MNNLSYLLISDDKIDLSVNPNKRDSLKAHLKYSLLFEEKILITDAHLLGNRNLRWLLEFDNSFIDLFDKENLCIALRDYIDFTPVINKTPSNTIYNPNLSEIHDGFISWNKGWNKNAIESSKYSQKKEIKLLQNKAEIKRYNYFSINDTYTNDVLELFNSDIAKKRLGEKNSNKIFDFAKEKRQSLILTDINEKGGLGPNFFKNELEENFSKKEWRSIKKEVIQIAEAPYLTALPKVLEANPIYGNEHRNSIELLKNPSFSSSSEPIGELMSYKTRLLRFEEGINRLPVNSIFKLRDSKEFREFRKKILQYNTSNTSIDEVLLALEAYKDKIDSEILFSFPDLREPKKIVRDKIQLELTNAANLANTYIGLGFSIMSIINMSFNGINELGLGTSVLSLFLPKWINKIESNIEIKKMKLNKKLSNDLSMKEIYTEPILNKLKAPINGEVYVKV